MNLFITPFFPSSTMLLRSLHLQNIRSYTEESISFPEGSLLLAGDIGSGKSSLLLAVEFALFGTRRGELSGSSLLRHGAQKGSVTLTAEIADKEVTITRTLKRSGSSITQESGTLTIDGSTFEGTTQELKARMLELLNYPESLLRRRNSLFRYTVYTPQEEMKKILYESPEERMETFRKLFYMDRYKRARENAGLLLRDLRRDAKEISVKVEELTRHITAGAELPERVRTIREGLTTKKAQLVEAEKKVKTLKEEQGSLEKQRFLFEELQKRRAILSTRIEESKRRETEIVNERGFLSKRIEETETKLSPLDVDPKVLSEEEERLKSYSQKLSEKEKKLFVATSNHKATIERSKDLIDRIGSLDNCPTCRQKVDEDHKAHIRADEEARIKKAEEELAKLDTMSKEIQTHRERFEQKKRDLLEKQKLIEANKMKVKVLQELKARRVIQEKTLEDLKKKIDEFALQERKLAKELEEGSVDEEHFQKLRKKLEEASLVEHRLSISFAEMKKDEETITVELTRLNKMKEEIKSKRAKNLATNQRINWLEKGFIGLAYTIEKALFSSVYTIFNEAFRNWFSMLMEDESLTVRLNAEFSPIMIQNEYETSVENLSGGEKTSVALAYRLALARVVNDFMTNLRTRDILILDEPTDGFSSEQLDRIREVLDQLKLRQVIIVSHEPQMEGFVDHVIRIRKDGHESRFE